MGDARSLPPVAPTVATVLGASGLAPREARGLLAHAMGVAPERLIAHPRDVVDAAARTRFDALAERRRDGVPYAYLVGRQEFCGLEFEVEPAVLIPRPETELLVETALAWLQGRPLARVLDAGTGSGCIAVALAHARPDLAVWAGDRSPAAVHCARANARRHAAAISFFVGDWLAPVGGCFDLIVSNPPYIAQGDPHLAALRHEPTAALTDGAEGRGALEILIAQARSRLGNGACLLLEHGYDQGAWTRDRLRAAGFDEVRTLRDLAGHERLAQGIWRGV